MTFRQSQSLIHGIQSLWSRIFFEGYGGAVDDLSDIQSQPDFHFKIAVDLELNERQVVARAQVRRGGVVRWAGSPSQG